MVLRGSKTAPSNDLFELRKALEKAKFYVEQTEKKEFEIEEGIAQIIHDELHSHPTEKQISRELTETLKILISNLEFYEEERKEAKKSYFELNEQIRQSMGQLLCGGIAGGISRTTVAPIDRIKLLIQTAKARKKETKSIIQTGLYEINNAGIISLWKGNLTNCFRVFPYAAIQFATYEKYKNIVLNICEKNNHKFGVFERLLSGALAGATAATLTYPLDVIRVRQACFNEIKGPFEASKLLYKEGGIISFYKGWTPTVISLAPFIGINFATFDQLKSTFIPNGDTKNASSILVLCLGAGAGLFAQTICYPLDTVRRNMQIMPGNEYSGVISAWKTIYKTDGIIGFYRGIIPNAIKIIPNNSIRFLAYSKLTEYLGVTPRQKGDGGGGFGG